MTTLTLEMATDGQRKQLARFAADAADKAVQDYTGLTKEGAQLIHGNAEFAARIREATTAALRELSITDRFKDEEVRSIYAYPPEYKGPKPILEQVQALKHIFPQLDVTATIEWIERILPTLQLSVGAEGWFAIPRWRKIADIYGIALEIVLEKIVASDRSFHNYQQGELGPDRLRLHPRTAAMWEQIEQEQKGDILIVPVQYGMRHRGRSIRRAREVIVRNPIEFGFDPFAGGCMALVHPERYIRFSELDTDFPGAEYDFPDDGDRWSGAPYLVFGGRLGFDAYHIGDANGHYGSVSGFLPQSNLVPSGS